MKIPTVNDKNLRVVLVSNGLKFPTSMAFIGPNDLHAQLGLPPSSEGAEPAFMEALERVKVAARKHSVALGIFSRDGEAAVERMRQGFQMVTVTTDISSMIAAATENLRRARE